MNEMTEYEAQVLSEDVLVLAGALVPIIKDVIDRNRGNPNALDVVMAGIHIGMELAGVMGTIEAATLGLRLIEEFEGESGRRYSLR